MNRSPMTPATPPTGRLDAAGDDRLKEALRALPPPAADPARREALQQRVLAQWQAVHATPGLQSAGGDRGLARLVLAGPGRRRWLLGSGVLLGGVALAFGLWLRQPDPLLEDLAQPDVLSQMAIGEM